MDPDTETYPPEIHVRYCPPKDDPIQETYIKLPPHTQPTFYLKKNLPNHSN